MVVGVVLLMPGLWKLNQNQNQRQKPAPRWNKKWVDGER
jgi:hypothetical protein